MFWMMILTCRKKINRSDFVDMLCTFLQRNATVKRLLHLFKDYYSLLWRYEIPYNRANFSGFLFEVEFLRGQIVNIEMQTTKKRIQTQKNYFKVDCSPPSGYLIRVTREVTSVTSKMDLGF